MVRLLFVFPLFFLHFLGENLSIRLVIILWTTRFFLCFFLFSEETRTCLMIAFFIWRECTAIHPAITFQSLLLLFNVWWKCEGIYWKYRSMTAVMEGLQRNLRQLLSSCIQEKKNNNNKKIQRKIIGSIT